MTAHMRLVVIATVLLVATPACGGGDDAATSNATPSPSSAGASNTLAPPSIASQSTSGSWVSTLVDVRVEPHERFDRVTFEFEGALPPQQTGHLLVSEPAAGDGDCNADIAGTRFISFFWSLIGVADELYDHNQPPKRVIADGASVVTEAVVVCYFEAMLTVTIGLSDVVEIRTHAEAASARATIEVDVRPLSGATTSDPGTVE